MGVFDVDPEKGLTLIEIAPDTRQQLQKIPVSYVELPRTTRTNRSF